MCVGLFSHKHQQAAVQTSVCQVAGGSPKGVGGRMADALSGGGSTWKTSSFSLYGNNIFSKGVNTNFQVIDPDDGNVRFFYLDTHEEVLANVTGQTYKNKFCEEYAQAVLEQVHAADSLGNALDPIEVAGAYDQSFDLGKQLHTVARLIKARENRGAERDFFFVQTNQWDMHHGLMDDLPEALGEMDTGINDFVNELKVQGIFDSVTLVTHSDFGRTLTTNGEGADHAWAGQHMVIGGSVNGGRVFNDYPSTLFEHSDTHTNEYDMGRGRLIPKYPWESMMVPVAKWVGVEDAQLDTVFPNRGNFNDTFIIGQASGAAKLFL
jgi:uncharacterized protein (DUF1501 family)